MRLQTPHDPAYRTCHYTHAWLRIMSDEFDVDEVTSLVKAQPTRTQRKGDIRSKKKKSALRKNWMVHQLKRSDYL